MRPIPWASWRGFIAWPRIGSRRGTRPSRRRRRPRPPSSTPAIPKTGPSGASSCRTAWALSRLFTIAWASASTCSSARAFTTRCWPRSWPILQGRGLAVESEGAIVVHVEQTEAPFIVRKRDGAFNYATTDLATIKYRVETWHPDQILYVVDHRQGDHFKQLFEVARKWGYDSVELEHVAFGTILGSDRRPFKTREGDVVGLESLLDESTAEALKVVKENSPELDPAEQQQVAAVVGLGAIKYADLSQNRISDYVFDWQKMMAKNGNTATYMQYAYARTRSVFRKAGITAEAIREKRPAIALSHPAERGIGVRLLRLPEVLEFAAEEYKPNVLTDYLFELANAFSTFWEECPVLKAESAERRDSRLALCDLTARTLKFGLDLLGIDVVERM